MDNTSVAENQPIDTSVGTFDTTGATGTFTYTLVMSDTTCTGVDNRWFTIVNTDTLKQEEPQCQSLSWNPL